MRKLSLGEHVTLTIEPKHGRTKTVTGRVIALGYDMVTLRFSRHFSSSYNLNEIKKIR